jgi:hypothetical protein
MSKERTQDPLQAKTSEVKKLLQTYGVPVEQFGTGKAKTLEHLAQEILEGETVLVDKDGKIVRRVELVHIDVRFTQNGDEFQLVEDGQVFIDGRERRRGLTGISEKMKPGENPLICAKRALAEEIGVDSGNDIQVMETEEETKTSPSYPGLSTEYRRHKMKITISEKDFLEDGYTEVQPDKTTYFVWRRI